MGQRNCPQKTRSLAYTPKGELSYWSTVALYREELMRVVKRSLCSSGMSKCVTLASNNSRRWNVIISAVWNR